MTAITHPHELELFEYVEGELDEPRRLEVAGHVAKCERCAEQVQLLEAGRTALRESALLHLPPKRREELFATLPRRRDRGLAISPKRLVAVLTPVAAVVAVIVIAANSDIGGGGSDEEAAAPAPAEALAEESGRDAGPAAAEPAPAAPAGTGSGLESAAAAPLLSLEGPPSEVVRFLRDAGFEAKVVDGTVEVVGRDPDEVEFALLDYARGDVPVYVR